MVLLIVWPQPFQNFQRLFLCRFFYCHRLKSPLQSGVLFNIFTIFLQSSRSDQLYLSSGKRGFQDIGSIQSAFRAACSDYGMQLVNKKKNASVLPHFIHHISDTLFKFSSVFTSCYHTGKIQYNHPLIFYRVRNHTGYDPLCKTLGNSGFAHAGFAYQTGIILSPPAENLDNTGDLPVSSHHGIQFSFCGHSRQITAVLVKHGSAGTVFLLHGFCSLHLTSRSFPVDSHGSENRRIQFLDIDPHSVEQSRSHGICFLQHGKKNMLCARQLFFLRSRLRRRCLQQPFSTRAVFRRPLHYNTIGRRYQTADQLGKPFLFHPELFQNAACRPLRLFQKSGKDMFRPDITVI